jgi:hypothetical protein
VSAPEMLLQSASSGLGCSPFGLILNHDRKVASGVRFRSP